jgi:hypothetical protein
VRIVSVRTCDTPDRRVGFISRMRCNTTYILGSRTFTWKKLIGYI